MSLYSRLISILDRKLNGKITLKKFKKNLDISPSAKLTNFKLDNRTQLQNRLYVKIAEDCLINTQITFESPEGYVEIGPRSYLGGDHIICRSKVIIGSDVTMAWGVTIYDHNSHSLDWQIRKKTVKHFYDHIGTPECYEKLNWEDVSSKPITIGDKAWIGFDVVILKGVTIGEGAIIGARSVVTSDVEPYTVVAGNPARKVKELNNHE